MLKKYFRCIQVISFRSVVKFHKHEAVRKSLIISEQTSHVKNAFDFFSE